MRHLLLVVVLAACGGTQHDTPIDAAPDADQSGDPCADQTCSDHGTCVITGGMPACQCADGFHAEGLTCIQNGQTGPCANVDCSGHGTCYVDNGDAACLCDAGYTPNGTSCVADTSDCVAWTDPLTTLDVPAIRLGGTLTAGGGPLGYVAALDFESTTSDDRFSVSVGSDGAFQTNSQLSTIPVVPGTYKVYYRQLGGGGYDKNPWNRRRYLTAANLATDAMLALDVPVVQLGGHLTAAGGPLGYVAALDFESTTTDDTFSVSVGSDGAFQTNSASPTLPVAPGMYKVYYRQLGGGGYDKNPWNQRRYLTTA